MLCLLVIYLSVQTVDCEHSVGELTISLTLPSSVRGSVVISQMM